MTGSPRFFTLVPLQVIQVTSRSTSECPAALRRAVRVLWAQMTLSDIDAAKEALRDREGLTGQNWQSRIGIWQRGSQGPQTILNLPARADARGLDAAIW